jgi:hypothetical protein
MFKMRKNLLPVLIFHILFLTPVFAQDEGKVLSLENVTMSCYALGGDVKTLKDPVEAIYVSKGDAVDAVFWLKQVLVEGREEQKSFRVKDPLCIMIFRGFFPGLSKVFVRKVSLKGCEFNINADYWDDPEYSTPSQPAAIIPIGQLPPGDYNINLFVGSELRKKHVFKVKGR